jgi:hypothetical protein
MVKRKSPLLELWKASCPGPLILDPHMSRPGRLLKHVAVEAVARLGNSAERAPYIGTRPCNTPSLVPRIPLQSISHS